MTLNDTKKLIYKNKPVADLVRVRMGVMYYEAVIGVTAFKFEVPCDDTGDADFYTTMEAKLMLRWLKV
jgi:hypothetical protein